MIAARNPSTSVVSCRRSVSLRGADARVNRWLAESFTDAERQAVVARAPRTVAGMLAAKRAAVELCADIHAGLHERDFTVTHRVDRAPRIAAVSRTVRRDHGTLFVSISHTRATAWAVVAREQMRPCAARAGR